MVGIIAMFFTSLTSVLGHLCATKTPEEIKKYFNHFYSFNYVLGIIFFLGYYAVIDDVVAFLFGPGLELPRIVAFIITLNQFIAYLRNSQLLFRDASGTFYNDRWKTLAEGLTNLALSVLFVQIFPKEYGVVGVIVATIITTLLICDIVEPHIIFKYIFKQPARKFYIQNYSGIVLFGGCLLIMEMIHIDTKSSIAGILINGCISIAFSAVILTVLCMIDRSFRQECLVILRQAVDWLKKIGQRIGQK